MFRSTCCHLGGQDGEERGAKAAVRAVRAGLAGNPLVLRTGVKVTSPASATPFDSPSYGKS